MLDVYVDGDRLRFGERLAVSFHRTLRIPDDGRTYPLPPGFGLIPLGALRRAEGVVDVLVPLYRREAMWLGFSAAPWKPNALKVIVGGINAVSGMPDDAFALGDPQDYLVCPDQPWLDGFNAGGGVIRQFVAMPIGGGYGIEAGAGLPERGGIELFAYEPLPGRFPDSPPPRPAGPMRLSRPAAAPPQPREMAIGAGGRMRQKIYPDRFGRDVWDLANVGRIRVVAVDSRSYVDLAGKTPPPTPIDAATYTAAGLPWFDLYDELEGTLAPDAESRLKTIRERDRERRSTDADERPIDIPVTQVTVIGRGIRSNARTRKGATDEPASPHTVPRRRRAPHRPRQSSKRRP
jgi:hypothetical protein